jgi:hypothetical protein
MSAKIFPPDRSQAGPFDSSELELPTGFLDFGALRLAPTPDLAIKLEVEESTGRVVALTLEKSDSALQVSVFAASKHEGVWAEVMNQLSESITASGGIVSAIPSQLGTSLDATVQSGIEQSRRMRFLGVDGPRWFLRGSITGAALTDEAKAAELEALFRSLVVHRGDSPMPPKESLELVVPSGIITPPRPGI